MKNKTSQAKIIFRPTCFIQEIYQTIKCKHTDSGHDNVSEHSDSGSTFKPLICEICDKICDTK